MKHSQAKLLIQFLFILMIAGCAGNLTTNKIKTSGKYDNYTLLPNGWKLTPAGDQIGIDELPLNMVVTKDGKYAITSNSGDTEHSLSVIDINGKKEIQRLIVNKTWRGLAFNSDESKLFVSGGDNNLVYIYNFDKGNLSLVDSIIIGKPYPKEKISISGLDYLASKNYLLVGAKESNKLYFCDITAKKIIKKVDLGSECYDVKINHKGNYVYVSLWGDSAVAEISLNNFEIKNRIRTGDHPTEILIAHDDKRLFVANANNNSVSVIDLMKKEESEKLISSLKPDAPYGSTPNSICLNKDGSVLFVANADNNYLALFDVSEASQAKSIGFIPTGWYPTVVRYVDSKILVANGKGLTSLPNPLYKNFKDEYIGSLFKGTLSVINYPDEEKLKEYSAEVYRNTPYYSKKENWKGIQNVIPETHDGIRSDKIKHVFYVIKENRSYDQVYGDLKEGNGDSSLCLFGREVTPNQHRLVEDFTLFDNFYVDAEVSADGHNWSDAAYATDFVEKNWPTQYGGRGGTYDYEPNVTISRPSSGYIWNNALSSGLKVRDYGEYVSKPDEKKEYYIAEDERMNKYVCHNYPGWNLSISDFVRYKTWEKDFEGFEKKGNLPDFNIIYLPNDHTRGTEKNALTPKAYVAQNDYALGLLVDKISHSKFWKESVIFILEDDAQNGPDHVDAHRSGVLVISPYIKRHYVDHTLYSTSSVLKTIELILGLKPMTQFDLSANPMLFAITDTPNNSSFDHVEPLYDLNEKNLASAYGSEKSSKLNFSKPDAIPDAEFSKIIWKSIKGKDSPYPAPVRNAFVKVNYDKGDD